MEIDLVYGDVFGVSDAGLFPKPPFAGQVIAAGATTLDLTSTGLIVKRKWARADYDFDEK
jgi:hypothetical protein